MCVTERENDLKKVERMASGTIMGGGNGEKEGSNEKQSNEKQKCTDGKVYTRKSFKGLKNNSKCNSNVAQQPHCQLGILGSEDMHLLPKTAFAVASGDSSSQNRSLGNCDMAGGNGVGKVGFPRQESQVTINLSTKSKKEVRELRKKLENELDDVRKMVKKIEGKGGQKAGNGGCGRGADNGGKLKRVHSEVGSTGTPRVSKKLHQLSVSVVENAQGVDDNMEKEKRTPKANKFYRNSEFLLAKDKFPHAESNKKPKSNVKKGGGSESGQGFGLGRFSNQAVKSCSSLLDRLMKHKHAWVFNQPVDTVSLGLHDYFEVIKNPMDLGTVKFRLTKNWYKSPREFAEDVRLTFQNAMTYNPKGQDVHVMAEELSKIFEEKWTVIKDDYMRDFTLAVDHEVGLPTPTSKRAPSAIMPPPEIGRPSGRSESMTHQVDTNKNVTNSAHSARSAASKKPKAKDPNKREMTYDEKQKLSANLQGLPSEKLENVVQIIKKRNPSLCQKDDEIEVDIDSVDTETLWELDRFVTNYKKSLSKNKRKAELANQEREEIVPDVQDKNPARAAVEAPKERRPAQMEKKGDNASRSTNSSGSSSDSGSSSGDSDSRASSSDA